MQTVKHKKKGISIILCNMLIVIFAISGITFALLFSDYAMQYATALAATDPIIIAWMVAIYGGNKNQLQFNQTQINDAITSFKEVANNIISEEK